MEIELLDKNGKCIRTGIMTKKNRIVWNKDPNIVSRFFTRVNNFLVKSYLHFTSNML